MQAPVASIASIPPRFPVVAAASGARFATPAAAIFGKDLLRARPGFGFSPLRRVNAAGRFPKATRRSRDVVVSQLNDALRVIRIVVGTVNDSLEAGSKFVPKSVPRPAAKAIVAVAGIVAASFFFSSILSTISFILGISGIAYLAYRYLSKDENIPTGGKSNDPGSTEASIEEARRIMDKYK